MCGLKSKAPRRYFTGTLKLFKFHPLALALSRVGEESVPMCDPPRGRAISNRHTEPDTEECCPRKTTRFYGFSMQYAITK